MIHYVTKWRHEYAQNTRRQDHIPISLMRQQNSHFPLKLRSTKELWLVPCPQSLWTWLGSACCMAVPLLGGFGIMLRNCSEPFGTLVKSRHISLESLSTMFFCRYSAAPFQLLAGRVTPASSSTLSAFSASPHHPEGLRKSYIPTRFVLRFCGENWHLKLVETEMEISMKHLWKTIYRCHVFEVLDLPTDWNTERHQSAQT